MQPDEKKQEPTPDLWYQFTHDETGLYPRMIRQLNLAGIIRIALDKVNHADVPVSDLQEIGGVSDFLYEETGDILEELQAWLSRRILAG